MKKENVLVVVLIGLVVLGGWFFYNSKTGSSASARQDLIVAGNQTGMNSGNGDGIDFRTYAEGMKLAQNQNKHVFLYFYADW